MMLVPHLHFIGNCAQAISVYEVAFCTKAYTVISNRQYGADEDGIAHAEMLIHGQRVMLNDRFGKKDRDTNIAVNLVVLFSTAQELLDCYGVLQENCTIIDELQRVSYSELVVQFIDRFGVQWGFMVE